jgi:hypothetical protein
MSAVRPADDETTRLGMLLEAAHSQQELISAGIEQFQSLARDLDEIVRAQIRRTLAEELGSLCEETQRLLAVLRGVEGAARLRLLRLTLAMTLLSAAGSAGVAYWWLPSHAQISMLREQRDSMRAEIDALAASGGRVDLRRCGDNRRWCVRVERHGPTYGADSDFLIVKGY